MKVKTENLSGAVLDFAVGKAKGLDLAPVEYSKKWEFGGEIIERERIDLHYEGAEHEPDVWAACVVENWDTKWGRSFPQGVVWGETPLIAAMRCYVARKLGDEVEVPDCFFNRLNKGD